MSTQKIAPKKRWHQKTELICKSPEFGVWLSMGVCGQLRGVTLERNGEDYGAYHDAKIVVDGVEWKE